MTGSPGFRLARRNTSALAEKPGVCPAALGRMLGITEARLTARHDRLEVVTSSRGFDLNDAKTKRGAVVGVGGADRAA